MTSAYDYFTAFQRNIGFLSKPEQEQLRRARVAVAGLGGTGGAQVHALARMGVGAFTLADPDVFELANFNRQSGASMETLGRRKTHVARDVIKGINPEADVRLFEEGVNAGNIEAFLDDVDVVVDSLDFYCFAERFLLYRTARARALWVLTSPPLGFGFSLLCFDPHGMSFERYFDFSPTTPERALIASFIVGLAPKTFFFRYMDLASTDAAGHRVPSVGAAPFMVAGVVATEVTNLLTGKRPSIAVPTVVQYDALLRRYRCRRYPLGLRGPFQRLKKAFFERRVLK